MPVLQNFREIVHTLEKMDTELWYAIVLAQDQIQKCSGSGHPSLAEMDFLPPLMMWAQI